MQRKLLNQIKGIIFTILWIFPLCVFAQNMTVRGTVTDANGELLIGVSVRMKNTNIGTITDADGNFEIQNVSQNALLSPLRKVGGKI